MTAALMTRRPAGTPPIILPGVTLRSLSEEVSERVLRRGAPLWWWVGFGTRSALLLVLVVAVDLAVRHRRRHLGHRHPGRLGVRDRRITCGGSRIASGGTIVSALFYLTRSPWRSAVNRIAEKHDAVRRRCAGIMPILHLGRPGFFYWLFPYPNVMGLWPQFRSPLLWDFVCLLCYILMSIMYYYVGLLPDLATVRDLAPTRGKQIFYGILALGWRGSARHWRNQQDRLRHHGGDHGADGRSRCTASSASISPAG